MFIYIDDITFSKSFKDHLVHLQCFKAVNLRLNPQKCKFYCSEVKYVFGTHHYS